MGGYSPSPPRKTPKEKCLESLESFLRNKNVSHLLEAYEHIKATNDSLVSTLLSFKNKELVKELSDYEIEYKANVTLSSHSKLFSKEKEIAKKDLESIHKLITFERSALSERHARPSSKHWPKSFLQRWRNRKICIKLQE